MAKIGVERLRERWWIGGIIDFTLLSELNPFSDDGWFEDKIKATESLVSEICKQLAKK